MRDKNRKDRRERSGLKGTITATATKDATPPQRQPRGRGALADLHPFQGLVHLHVLQPVLGLPSAPPGRLCLPRCAAVYAEQFLRAAGLSSTRSGFNGGGRHIHRHCLRRGGKNNGEKIPFTHSTSRLLSHRLIGLRLSICDGRTMWQPVFTLYLVFA